MSRVVYMCIYIYIVVGRWRWTLPSFKEKRRRLVGQRGRRMEFAAKSERVVGRGKTALLRRWKIARRHWPYQLYLSPTKKRIKRIHLLPRYHPPAVLYALLNEILIPPPPPLLHVKSLWIISHLFEMYKCINTARVKGIILSCDDWSLRIYILFSRNAKKNFPRLFHGFSVSYDGCCRRMVCIFDFVTTFL